SRLPRVFAAAVIRADTRTQRSQSAQSHLALCGLGRLCGSSGLHLATTVEMQGMVDWLLGVFLTPLGACVLAALDSTTFFWFPLGIDAVVVILVARRAAPVWLVLLLAIAGSLAGAALTFFIGARIGDEGLERFGAKK